MSSKAIITLYLKRYDNKQYEKNKLNHYPCICSIICAAVILFFGTGYFGCQNALSENRKTGTYWATYEGVFNKPKNKRLAEEIVRKNEQDSLNIKAYYINFDKRENIKLCTSTLKGR